MTGDTLGIGDLARRTGVPVRTIRFYCDEGLLDPVRSVGGHRRFDQDAIPRLDLVRRLRALGLGLPAITSVLTGERSMGEAVAAERAALDVELSALAWRRACLSAVEQAGPAERAARLELLAAAQDGRVAHQVLAVFWRDRFTNPVPDETLAMFLDVSAPPPPTDPSPAQVVAYAELVALVNDPALAAGLRASAHANAKVITDEAALQDGVGAACAAALPKVAAGQAPGPGQELDLFVATHAAVRGHRDSPSFRRSLLADVAVDRDPRMRRYWTGVRVVTAQPVALGESHTWLLDSLAHSIGAS
ncbi:MerR family transcriptional regulator [Actinokineospora globicatena]|uniref:helix-turn-helix domain-containing protein n=1 Tax=Actinokineospora globicatena TaxID=103729 RepID=UPI0020A5BFB9|nr:MerR family transcriptional regulator [Actinokineospora globicatena]MCP2306723.1 DNA-binding transcriptional regulator, MerR family [Actinokineospora globicatena]GLW82160.1 MerR family transcriptional regulator [Actinokineospora globicatena]GLW88953.1 MerR family transcriptional regulator [Actinokineospora globicatena]